jgi:hypothetical protein
MASPKNNDQTPPISDHSRQKAEAAKAYIANKYSRLKRQEEEKKQGWQDLQQKMDDMNLSHTEQELIRQEIITAEANQQRMMRRK